MGHIIRIYLVIVCVACIGIKTYAQRSVASDVDEEVKYLNQLAKARFYLQSGKTYEALEIYLALQAIHGTQPEVLLGLGHSYHNLGDVALSTESYAAFLQSKTTAIKAINEQDTKLVRYRLAHYYFFSQELEEYEHQLDAVIQESNVHDVAMESLYRTEGLDRFLDVYDIDFEYSFFAYREKGLYELFVKQEYTTGMTYVLTALSMVFNELEHSLKSIDIDYVFVDSLHLAEKISQHPKMLSFVRDLKIGRILDALLYYADENELKDQASYTRKLSEYLKPVSTVRSFYFPLLP